MPHPRIRERREAVAEEHGRVRMRRWMLALGLVVVALLAFAATRSPLLDVDEVRVIGATRTAPSQLRQIAAIEPGTPLVGLDLVAAEERLLALPTVAAVSTEQSWRGLVVIDVVEREPAARINTQDGTLVVAPDGIVLALTDAPDTNLPLISGAMFRSAPGEQVPDQLAEALAVASNLPSDLARVTERVELSVDDLELRLVGGGTVTFGDSRQLDEKFDAVRAVLDQVDLGCLEQLNVHAPLVPSLRRSEGCWS